MGTGDGSNDAMSTPVVIMTICDGPALLIIVQNDDDDDDDARRYGCLVMPRHKFDFLQSVNEAAL